MNTMCTPLQYTHHQNTTFYEHHVHTLHYTHHQNTTFYEHHVHTLQYTHQYNTTFREHHVHTPTVHPPIKCYFL